MNHQPIQPVIKDLEDNKTKKYGRSIIKEKERRKSCKGFY